MESSSFPPERNCPATAAAILPVSAHAAATPATRPVMVGLPAVLERVSFEHQLREFLDLFQPAGYLEFMLTRELARNAAAMELWGEAALALARQRALRLPELAVDPGGDGDELEDACLAAAVASPEVHLAEHHLQRRTRSFYRALAALEDIQSRRQAVQREEGCPVGPQLSFPTEAACEEHLKDRFEQGCHRCPRCGCTRGHFIAARRCWECASCGRQAGLRAGTVMADSPLPLVTWFTAIRLLLWWPMMGTAELAIKLGITRSATVRGLAGKIRAAMAADNASELLAGLDVDHARRDGAPPESGAQVGMNTGAEGGWRQAHRAPGASPDAKER